MRVLPMMGILLGCLLLMGAAVDSGLASAGPTLDIVALLREFGFPIFVAIWFMWRLEKRLDRYTEQIEKLYTIVTVMTKTLDSIDYRATRDPRPPGQPAPSGLSATDVPPGLPGKLSGG
jgi:YvrJ protein family